MTGATHAPTSVTAFPPRILIDQFASLFGNSSNLFTWATDNQWNIVPTITITKGTQTLKFGVDLVYAMRESGSIGQANGELSFNRYDTQRYPLRAGNSSDGSGIADVLLGIPGTGFADWNDTYYRPRPYYGFFIQNDWRALRNLTLNLGLRYDVQVPFVERWNRVNNGFDFNAKSPVSDQVLAAWAKFKAAYDATNPRFPYPDVPAALLGGKTFVPVTRSEHLSARRNVDPWAVIATEYHDSVVRESEGKKTLRETAGEQRTSGGRAPKNRAECTGRPEGAKIIRFWRIAASQSGGHRSRGNAGSHLQGKTLSFRCATAERLP